MKRAFNRIKWETFFINFHSFSVVKNCLRSENVPLITSAIKRGLFYNFTKTLKDRHFNGHVAGVFNYYFQLLFICKS